MWNVGTPCNPSVRGCNPIISGALAAHVDLVTAAHLRRPLHAATLLFGHSHRAGRRGAATAGRLPTQAGEPTARSAWMLHGCCMDAAWMLHGCCMGAAWVLHGCCMDAAWMLHGHGMGTAWAWSGDRRGDAARERWGGRPCAEQPPALDDRERPARGALPPLRTLQPHGDDTGRQPVCLRRRGGQLGVRRCVPRRAPYASEGSNPRRTDARQACYSHVRATRQSHTSEPRLGQVHCAVHSACSSGSCSRHGRPARAACRYRGSTTSRSL